MRSQAARAQVAALLRWQMACVHVMCTELDWNATHLDVTLLNQRQRGRAKASAILHLACCMVSVRADVHAQVCAQVIGTNKGLRRA